MIDGGLLMTRSDISSERLPGRNATFNENERGEESSGNLNLDSNFSLDAFRAGEMFVCVYPPPDSAPSGNSAAGGPKSGTAIDTAAAVAVGGGGTPRIPSTDDDASPFVIDPATGRLVAASKPPLDDERATSHAMAGLAPTTSMGIDPVLTQLVQAMATYSSDNRGFDPALPTQAPNDPALQAVIASAWHQ
jgi:hypothetical protein